MQKRITSFDTAEYHIHLEFLIMDRNGFSHSVSGILDTGAPTTEFSDQFLMHTGFIETTDEEVRLKTGLQTQKYETIILPSVNICGHQMTEYEIFVSRFEKSWGIDALIGLDFFRLYQVTIDYSKGILISEPY